MVQGGGYVPLADLLEERADTDQDNEVLERIKVLALEYLPAGWTQWEVMRSSKEDIFGLKVEATTLSKVTFALPTVSLVHAFEPDADHLSEKGYRAIRRKLVEWAFTRALILGPPAIVNRIQGSVARSEIFKQSVVQIRPLLYTRAEVNDILSGRRSEPKETGLRSQSVASHHFVNAIRRRRRRDLSPQCALPLKRSKVDQLEERMSNMFSILVKQIKSLKRPFLDDDGSDKKNNIIKRCKGEVEKNLHAAPVFNALKINTKLANIGDSSYDSLSRQDAILGTITHGLLMQRKALSGELKDRVADCPMATEGVRKMIAEGSQTSSISDNLLHYVRGQCAKTIKPRRKIFKPRNESLSVALHQIPPSQSYLFEEKALMCFIKENEILSQVCLNSNNTHDRNVKAFRKPPTFQPAKGKQPVQQCQLASQTLGQQLDRINSSCNGAAKSAIGSRGGSNNYVIFQGGQLESYLPQWQDLGAPDYVLKIISGYALPFALRPPSVLLRENLTRFATRVSSHMSTEIEELLKTGVVERSTAETGFLSRMFLIPKSNGKQRQIFDLRHLNKFLSTRKFRLINQSHVPRFLQQGDFMGKLDLSQAYFHVPIRKSHRRYLCFTYKGELFQMTSLPFGLSSAPFAFSRVSNWIANLMRERGLRVLVYLDDFLIAHQNPKLLESHMAYAIDILQSLGWCVNVEKSVQTPTRRLEFLGILWDTAMNRTELPTEKVSRVRKELEYLQTRGYWSWQTATTLIGRLGFASLVVPLGRLFTRLIQRAARRLSQDNPSRIVKIPTPALTDCLWWTQNINKPGKIFNLEPTLFITTDASDTGWGIQIGDSFLAGRWTEQQLSWHINRKELFAVFTALLEFRDMVREKSVMVQSDNKTVVAYLRNQGGTRSVVLLEIAKKTLVLAANLDVTLLSFYLPGRYNTIADCLSRGKPVPDWHLSKIMTTQIFKKWGIPQIDLFATDRSKVVSRYVSIVAGDPQAVFINAFSQSWHYQLAWVFPPPPLIPRVLQHLNASSGIYLVVVPRWERVFWRSDLKHRALEAPFQVINVREHLIDLSTGLPPPNVQDLCLEVWRIRGGVN